VAELVDALDSKSSSARSAGSIPARGTILKIQAITITYGIYSISDFQEHFSRRIENTRKSSRQPSELLVFLLASEEQAFTANSAVPNEEIEQMDRKNDGASVNPNASTARAPKMGPRARSGCCGSCVRVFRHMIYASRAARERKTSFVGVSGVF
jgi:hypothetical protein